MSTDTPVREVTPDDFPIPETDNPDLDVDEVE